MNFLVRFYPKLSTSFSFSPNFPLQFVIYIFLELRDMLYIHTNLTSKTVVKLVIVLERRQVDNSF